MKDSRVLRRYARDQIGYVYSPQLITYRGRDYRVWFEWCDDEQVNAQDEPMNGVIQFEPCESRGGLGYHYAFMVRRRGSRLLLDELDCHPNLDDDLAD